MEYVNRTENFEVKLCGNDINIILNCLTNEMNKQTKWGVVEESSDGRVYGTIYNKESRKYKSTIDYIKKQVCVNIG